MNKLNLAIPLLFSISTFTQASIITFDNLSSFVTSTSAIATTALPNTGLLAGSASSSQTVGDLTFSITSPSFGLFFGTAGSSVAPAPWTSRLAGNQIGISDSENLNIEMINHVSSFGFEFVEPENDPNMNGTFIDSIFEVTLLGNGSFIESFIFNANNDVAAFVGVSSDVAFNRVEIRELTGGPENEFFGLFYTSPVPVPTAVWLFGTSLAGLLGFKRQKINIYS